MKDLRNLRDRPFLVVTAILRPHASVNTNKKGWVTVTGNLEVYERCAVVDRVTDKVLREAQVILDLTRSAVVTSRFNGVAEDQVFQHYAKKYDAECDTGIRRWIEKLSNAMARDPKFIAEMEARRAAAIAENAAAETATENTVETIVADAAPEAEAPPADEAGA